MQILELSVSHMHTFRCFPLSTQHKYLQFIIMQDLLKHMYFMLEYFVNSLPNTDNEFPTVTISFCCEYHKNR